MTIVTATKSNLSEIIIVITQWQYDIYTWQKVRNCLCDKIEQLLLKFLNKRMNFSYQTPKKRKILIFIVKKLF